MDFLPHEKVTPGQLLTLAILFALITATTVSISALWVLHAELGAHTSWLSLVLCMISAIIAGVGATAFLFHGNEGDTRLPRKIRGRPERLSLQRRVDVRASVSRPRKSQ